MISPRRPHRFFWFFGLVLLVGTAAGAGWVLNQAPAGTPPSAPVSAKGVGDRYKPGANDVICLGYVDIAPGLTALSPPLPGRVTEVFVAEGDEVWDGYLLFRLDDRQARDQLARARADLGAAQAGKRKVERLRDTHGDQVAQQAAAVEVAKRLAKAQGFQVAIERKLFKDFNAKNTEKLAAVEETAKAAEERVRVEELKLKALRDYDFKPDLDQAEQNIRAKKATVREARLAVQECDVYAPADGRVLRLLVTPGEVTGRDPRQPAVQFCPALPRVVRTEVQQEWGMGVRLNQAAVIEDDTSAARQWTGHVVRISDWYAQRRLRLLEPFQFNDVRTLECLVAVNPSPEPLRIGQRMRVILKHAGP